MNAALHSLTRLPRSESELRSRLRQRGFEDAHIDKTLSKLKEQGLTDDVAFARLWTENRESFSPRSRFLLQRELRKKGLDEEIIAATVEGVDEESSAYRAAQKKARILKTSDYSSFQGKLIGFLRRRGFGYDVCRRTVNRVWQERSEGGQNAQ